MLGHEIAHIAQKHALKTIQRSQALQGIGELTLTALDKDPAMFDKVIDDLSKVIFEQGLERNLEFESDRLGAAYAARVGYNPRGLQRVLRRLAKAKSAKRRGLAKTHPAPHQRAQKLTQFVHQQHGPKPGGRGLGRRFMARMGK